MKSKVVLVAVVCLVATAAAQVPWEERSRPRWQVHALEGLGAVTGVVGCGCAGACALSVFQMVLFGNVLSIVFSPEHELIPGSESTMLVSSLIGVVSIAALPAVAGYGAAKVGDELGENGSQTLAIGGAYFGTAVGAGLVFLGGAVSRSAAVRVPLFISGGLCVPAGAVVGYNLGANGGGALGGFGGRLQPPGVALTAAELPDRSVEYGVRLQLAGLRF